MGKVHAKKSPGKQKKNAEAARKYRRKNLEEYNHKARERMARRRAGLSDAEKKESKNIQQEYSRISYIRNRDCILDKAAEERHTKHIEKHGNEEHYPGRDVRPRYLLGVRDPSTPLSERIYQQKLRIWMLEKKEKHLRKADEMLQQRMEQAWDTLEEEQFLAFVRNIEAGDGYL